MSQARTICNNAKLPPNLWGECVLTAVYLKNRTPTKVLDNKTPYEVWNKRKLNLSHLREIGCKAFVLIQAQHVPRIYSWSVECVLVSYSTHSKAYLWGNWVSYETATMYPSIDWNMEKNQFVYLFKNHCLIAKLKPYKNTIKYSLQFPYIFVLFGQSLSSLWIFSFYSTFWTHMDPYVVAKHHFYLHDLLMSLWITFRSPVCRVCPGLFQGSSSF